MKDDEQPQHERQRQLDEPKQRLPYEPPAIISEEAFETLALACGKTGSRCVPNLNS